MRPDRRFRHRLMYVAASGDAGGEDAALEPNVQGVGVSSIIRWLISAVY